MYFDTLVITFFVFSFLGFICEVIYCSIGQKKLANRGFLYGPFLPIYGFGGLIVKLCLVPFANKPIWGPIVIFLLSLVLCSIVEYIGSWMLEKFFSIKLWDYSKKFCNIHGRVCLLNSVLFGILGLAIVYIVEPPLTKYISYIPNEIRRVLSDLIIVGFVIDFTLSCVKMAAFKNALTEVRERRKELKERMDELKAMGKEEAAKEVKASLEEGINKAIEKARKHSSKILSSFPSASSKKEDIKAQLDALKSWREERIKNAKEKLKNKRKKDKNEH